jgi:hypothetical protein
VRPCGASSREEAADVRRLVAKFAGKLTVHASMENEAVYPRLFDHPDPAVRARAMVTSVTNSPPGAHLPGSTSSRARAPKSTSVSASSCARARSRTGRLCDAISRRDIDRMDRPVKLALEAPQKVRPHGREQKRKELEAKRMELETKQKKLEEQPKSLLVETQDELELALDRQKMCLGELELTKERLNLPLLQQSVTKDEKPFPLCLETKALGEQSSCLDFETKRKQQRDHRKEEEKKRECQMKMTKCLEKKRK